MTTQRTQNRTLSQSASWLDIIKHLHDYGPNSFDASSCVLLDSVPQSECENSVHCEHHRCHEHTDNGRLLPVDIFRAADDFCMSPAKPIFCSKGLDDSNRLENLKHE